LKTKNTNNTNNRINFDKKRKRTSKVPFPTQANNINNKQKTNKKFEVRKAKFGGLRSRLGQHML
jgi:hypothetical protein